MDGFTKVGAVKEFQGGKPARGTLDGLNIVIVKVIEDVVAFENSCPHQHFSLLHQGTLEGCNLTCPMHGWTFDIRSGQSTNGNGRLKMLEVKIEDGAVWVAKTTAGPSYALFDA
jgi:nitrite reductase/ring-hydroxylating ferredoxin subunit